jgi:hypothetical protein
MRYKSKKSLRNISVNNLFVNKAEYNALNEGMYVELEESKALELIKMGFLEKEKSKSKKENK